MKMVIGFFALGLMMPLFAGAVETEVYESCVVQVQKNDLGSSKAQFVLACGSETLMVHEMTAFDRQNEQDIQALKTEFISILRNLVGVHNVTCTQTDSEVFWIGICHQN